MNTLSAVLSEKTAHCDLPSGEHLVRVEVTNRVPLYTLARKLEAMGFGDWKLQAYTLPDTPHRAAHRAYPDMPFCRHEMG